MSHRDAAGPPIPVPPHLWPLRSPLAGDDLRVAASTEELRVIATLLEREGLAGYTLLTLRDGSPWLELDVAVPSHDEGRDVVRGQVGGELMGAGVYRYAIWRYTARAYRVGPDGAVEDDPIL